MASLKLEFESSKRELVTVNNNLGRDEDYMNHILEVSQQWKRGAQLDTTVGRQCIICLSRNANYIVKPCNHLLFCKECINDYLNTSTMCPLCKQSIQTVEMIYA